MRRLPGFRYDTEAQLAHLERRFSAASSSRDVEFRELDTQPCGDRLDSRRAVD